MSRSVCVRLLWCMGAYALVAQAHGDRRVPDCPNKGCRNTGTTYLQSIGKTVDTFEMHSGKDHMKIYAEEETLYYAECQGIHLMMPTWPTFNHRLTVEDAELSGCGNNFGTSYAFFLMYQVNVTFTKRLRLTNIPDDTIFQNALSQLPNSVEELTIAKANGVLQLSNNALDVITGVKRLVLRHVKPQRVPTHLTELDMSDSGMKELLPGTLSLQRLVISEPELQTVNGSAPNLKYLKFSNAQSLKSVALRDTPHELFQDGQTDWGSYLQGLEFTQSQVQVLPTRLLTTAPSLFYFAFKQGNITTVPQNFFSNTKQLRVIDLSNNNLGSLPSDLFSVLNELRVLRLEENCFKKNDLSAVWQVSSLTALNLQGNPLGDLCDSLNPTTVSLTQLEELYLSRTNAVRICGNFLRTLHALRYVDLRENNVRTLSCAFLANISDNKNVVIDLTVNPLTKLDCTDKGKFTGNRQADKQTILLTDKTVDCNCDCPHAQCLPANLLMNSA